MPWARKRRRAGKKRHTRKTEARRAPWRFRPASASGTSLSARLLSYPPRTEGRRSSCPRRPMRPRGGRLKSAFAGRHSSQRRIPLPLPRPPHGSRPWRSAVPSPLPTTRDTPPLGWSPRRTGRASSRQPSTPRCPSPAGPAKRWRHRTAPEVREGSSPPSSRSSRRARQGPRRCDSRLPPRTPGRERCHGVGRCNAHRSAPSLGPGSSRASRVGCDRTSRGACLRSRRDARVRRRPRGPARLE